MVKRLSTVRDTWVRSLGQEDPLEKEMAIHSSATAWKIPWTEELGPWGRKESDTTERLHFPFKLTFFSPLSFLSLFSCILLLHATNVTMHHYYLCFE